MIIVNTKQKIGLAFVVVVSLVFVGALYSFPPIPQPPEYHNFKDARTIWRIPHFWNVITNLPFLFVGLWGIVLLRRGRLRVMPQMSAAYYVFFAGVAAVAFGSAYYHVEPSNETLFWDRLPIAVSFMALFAVIIAEFASPRWGGRLFIPLAVCGFASVMYWHITERAGAGDLRFYVVVQFLPMVIIPVLLLTGAPRYTKTAGYWWLLAAYVAAKAFEHWDGAIYDALRLMSGHPLKHLAAAVGVVVLIRAYERREPRH